MIRKIDSSYKATDGEMRGDIIDKKINEIIEVVNNDYYQIIRKSPDPTNKLELELQEAWRQMEYWKNRCLTANA